MPPSRAPAVAASPAMRMACVGVELSCLRVCRGALALGRPYTPWAGLKAKLISAVVPLGMHCALKLPRFHGRADCCRVIGATNAAACTSGASQPDRAAAAGR
jgi:hypothetical protein